MRHIKDDRGLPFILLVSNWSLMTEERYLALREAGVDEFCVSLDFPDERHDDFRGHPGLYEHLEHDRAGLPRSGTTTSCLNNCIHAENVGEINAAPTRRRSGASTSTTAPTRRGAPATASCS